MEKYLRLLSPKSINYEADRIDGGTQQLTAQDVMLALSYANLSQAQSILVELYLLNQNSEKNLKLAVNFFMKELALKWGNEKLEHLEKSIYIALVEFCAVAANYKPSIKNRAVIGGVSMMQIRRYLGSMIDNHKIYFGMQVNDAEFKINQQF